MPKMSFLHHATLDDFQVLIIQLEDRLCQSCIGHGLRNVRRMVYHGHVRELLHLLQVKDGVKKLRLQSRCPASSGLVQQKQGRPAADGPRQAQALRQLHIQLLVSPNLRGERETFVQAQASQERRSLQLLVRARGAETDVVADGACENARIFGQDSGACFQPLSGEPPRTSIVLWSQPKAIRMVSIEKAKERRRTPTSLAGEGHQ
mmetsp:Transcript_10541/g.19756  ORF Transcript_10541/g.19756 Transcript_10541/m.19756 type:complete len:205 (+) Transcript_10541:403-1017(+)